MKTDTTGMPGEETVITADHETSAAMFLCWPCNALDLAKRDEDLPKLVQMLARFIAGWEAKGRVAALLPSEKGLKAGRPEPFLPAELEDTADGTDADWNAKALDALAAQLGYGNDFYYPLIGAAQELRQQREAIARSLTPAAGEGGEDKSLENRVAKAQANQAETIPQLKPPFEIYHDEMDICDANGHVCSAENPEIAKALLNILSGSSPIMALRREIEFLDEWLRINHDASAGGVPSARIQNIEQLRHRLVTLTFHPHPSSGRVR